MSDRDLTPPILLIGNVRSGTSMLQSFFELCPGIATWFEPRTVWMYADPARRHDRFDASDATPRVKRYIRRRFLARQHAEGARIMEKTPSNTMRLPFVHAVFPESKLIYVVRNPLSQVASSEMRWQNAINRQRAWVRFLETPKTQLHYYAGKAFADHFRKRVLRKRHVGVWGVRYPGIYEDLKAIPREEVIAKQWAECSRQMAEDIAALPDGLVYQVRYEDLVADPIAHFGPMCRHVGVEPTSEILEQVRERADPGRQDNWKRLDPELIRAMLPHLTAEMARHGYEPPDKLPDEEERRRYAAAFKSRSGPGSARTN